jgi:putative ABC transport system permease protein
VTSVALRGLAARKLRAVLTAIAIVLGVAMVSGSYVLTDSIQRAFHTIFTSSYDNTDAVISGKKLVDYSSSGNATVSQALLEQVRRQPDVAEASGVVMDLGGGVTTAKLYDKHGKLIEANGNPTFGFGIDPAADRFNPMRLTSGAWAGGPHQVVIDKNTADKYDFSVGDTIRATADAGTFPFRVSGIAKYGDVESLGGATFAVFDVPTAQRLLKMGDSFTAISVAAKQGVTPEQLVKELRSVTPSTAVVRTGAQQAKKDEKDIAFFVKFIRWFLLAFGFIALFVGGFVIFNTLSITVAQRTRELATLRTLGASRRQVLRSVVLEAFVIGLVASVVGLVAGIGLARGLSALFGALDLSLPESGLPVEPRTIVVSLLLGTVLTVVAGLIPAVRATRVAPILAVREGSTAATQKLSRVAPIAAAVLGALAAALLLYGFYGKGMPAGRRILVLVFGTLTMFVGLAAIFSRLVRPLVWLIGKPFEKVGRSAGRLAAFNVRRNPGRTASTAAALMIGITLVTFVSLFGRALQSSDVNAVKKQVQADYVVTSPNGWDVFPAVAADAAKRVPGVELVSHVYADRGRAAGANATVNGVDPRHIASLFHFDWKHGSDAVISSLGRNQAIVKSDFASKHGIAAGDRFVFQGPNGKKTVLLARGIYEPQALDALLGSVVVSQDTFRSVLPRPRDQYAFVEVAGGASSASTRALQAALDKSQLTKIRDRDAYADYRAAGFSQVLNLLYILLALSVIVSLFGIVNTLALAVYERTRELGMLRAIGMTRRQVRRMVRQESIMTSLLGAALGLPAGIALAALAIGSLAKYGVSMSLPVGALVAFVAVAMLVGVLAAILPARRAGKLNVLAAVSYE